MDEFDWLLEFHLRRKLDPVVAAPVPVRRGRAVPGLVTKHRGEATKKYMRGLPIELLPDVLVFVKHS